MRAGPITNIAVPSLVAFPPAFDIVSVRGEDLAVKSVDLFSVPLDAEIMDLYRLECETAGLTMDDALSAETYGAFLYRHTRALAVHRYLPREWPEGVVSVSAAMTISALLQDARTSPRGTKLDISPLDMSDDHLQAMSVIDLVTDWYCLRQGGALAAAYFGEQKIAQLKALAKLYCENIEAEETRAVASWLANFFRSLDAYLDRATADNLPSSPKA